MTGGIEFRKAVRINAPVEEVFAFWQNYDNFPRFMSHLKEVRDMGDGRSHWVANGPAGTPVEWDAQITETAAEPGDRLGEPAGVGGVQRGPRPLRVGRRARPASTSS